MHIYNVYRSIEYSIDFVLGQGCVAVNASYCCVTADVTTAAAGGSDADADAAV